MAEKRGKESRIKGNSLGASGFTLGIVSIVSLGWFGIILSVVGFVFCLLQQLKKPTKLGKAGIILNAIGFVFSIVWIIYLAPRLVGLLQQLNTST